MKRIAFAAALILAAAAAWAAPTKLGLGIFLGQPTGLSVGLDVSRTSWLDFKAAWDFSGPKDSVTVILQGNYEQAFPGALIIEGQDIVPFVGIGSQVAVGSETPALGIRIPFGLNYRFSTAPIELFLELGFGLYIFPATKFMGSGGFGIRYRL
jgi:hypothetical protein